jgi:hypothetical protein
MAEPDDSNIMLIVTAALGTILCVVAIVLAVQGLYYDFNTSEDARKNVNLTYNKLAELREAQQQKLIKFNMDEAMKKTAQELAAKQGK